MKIAIRSWVCLMAPSLLLAAAAAHAQDAHAAAAGLDAGTVNRRDLVDAEMEQARAQARAARLEQLAAEVKLGSNELARIRAVLEEQDNELALHQKAARARQTAQLEALKSGDTQAQEKLRRESSDASSRQIEIYRKYSQAMLDVMTPEQQRTWRVFGMYQSVVNGRLRGCELSDDQKAQVRALCAQAVGSQSTNAVSARLDYAKLNEEIESTVLTAEQRDQVLLHPLYTRVLRDLHGCELTPEQEQRVRALCLEAARAAQTATAADAGASPVSIITQARDVAENVKRTLLTDAQKLEMESDRLYESLINFFRGCSLTPEQDARVLELCRTAAADFGPSPDFKARNGARQGVVARVRAGVLTDEQRAKLPPPKPVVQVLPVGAATNAAPTPASR